MSRGGATIRNSLLGGKQTPICFPVNIGCGRLATFEQHVVLNFEFAIFRLADCRVIGPADLRWYGRGPRLDGRG